MKKKLVLLVLLVSFLALSLTFLSCEEADDGALKLSGTKWVLGYSKAELAAEMDVTEAYLDIVLAALNVNFPVPVMQIEFTSDKDFKMSQNPNFSNWDTINTPSWQTVASGTYTVSGNDVTMDAGAFGSGTATVSGNTLTLISDDGSTTMKFTKQ